MKLLSKYRRYTITTLILVAIASFCAMYYLFRYSIHRTTDDVLNEYRIDFENYARDHEDLEPYKSIDMRLSTLKLQILPGGAGDIDETICDTLVFSHYEKEMVVYRKLEFPVVTSDYRYRVMLMLPTLEEHDLVGTVIVALALVVLFFILFSYITDWTLTRKILKPFYRILSFMRTYKIGKPAAAEVQSCGIDEFDEMNRILKGMMEKINRDYHEMKDFLENTSHELQTPLSIIQLNLEALSQKETDDEETIKNIASIRNAANRINRFNQSLLLIARINNNQFTDTQSININRQISQFMTFYEEILSMRRIEIRYECREDFVVDLHPLIAEYLIQNIMTNAVKHNFDGGTVTVCTSANEFRIKNTFKGKMPAGNLFDKYIHQSNIVGSNGIGMAIVKSICDNNGLAIRYTAENGIFELIISRTKI